MAEDLGEKTEQPTAKRLADARQKGQIPKSADLSSAMLLISILVMLVALGAGFLESASALLRRTLGGELLVAAGPAQINELLLTLIRIAWPALAVAFLIAYVVNFVQVGWLLSAKPLQPKFKQFHIVKGLGKMVSRRNWVKGLINVGKLALVGGVAVLFVRANLNEIAALPLLHLTGAIAVLGSLMIELALWALLLLILLGVADYLYQRWQHTEDHKMTKQEVKDERKNMDGDPAMKRRQLDFGRAILNQQMRKSVPSADVIVTNPTHFAVALKYEHGSWNAPRVVAKGADFMAMQIRYIGAANGVPIIERPPLARALYYQCEVGQEIPSDLYEAVAELLAYVYRLDGRAAS
ncbi:MAG: flagellar biosynthesis protein FlhB [Phycisphaeraceae bacterium]|nr:flagellar biosynthesis protein FlhB [Phycisphaeraceae bacterium]